MRTRFAQVLTVFTLVAIIGGHWVVLQSIAWVGMMVSYSRHATLANALEKTFDGKHPCNLCKVVQEAKKAERKQILLKVESKLDFWLVATAALPEAPAIPPVALGAPRSFQLRLESPPKPPPRLV